MNWRDYEVFITKHFQRLFPDAVVRHDVKVPGLMSRTERQVDILIEGRIAGFDLRLIVDCKYFGKKVDVKDVDEFLGYLHDVKASKGVLITNHGYTEAAYNRATYDTRDVELRIIGLAQLEQYQSYTAIAYAHGHGIVITAPDGWVIDAAASRPQLAALYPFGLSRSEAGYGTGYIYLMASKKDAAWPDLHNLLARQAEHVMRHHVDPRIDHASLSLRSDAACHLRHIERREVPGTLESTLFIDYPEIIFFLNLLAPSRKHDEYLRKLLWMGEKLIKVNVLYDPRSTPLSMPPSLSKEDRV